MGTHCDHWWDGDEDDQGNTIALPCCWCGDNSLEANGETEDEHCSNSKDSE